MQLLVVVSGRTICLECSGPLSVSSLKTTIYEKEGLPENLQRLYVNGKLLQDTYELTHEIEVPIRVSLDGLLGGKGGFGSLLRSTAHRVGQKKNSNFSACRDLNGRRLRHVEAEQKLAEWASTEHKTDPHEIKRQYRHAKDGTKEPSPCKFGDKCRYKFKCPFTHPEDIQEKQRRFDLTHMATKLSRDEDEHDVRSSVENAVTTGLKASQDRRRKVKITKLEDASEQKDARDDDVEAERSAKKQKASVSQSLPSVSTSSSSTAASSSSSVQFESFPVPFADLTPLDIEPIVPSLPISVPPAEVLRLNPEPEEVKAEEKAYAAIELSKAKSPADLEHYGLEHLKAELTRVGLKCGGNLTERCQRLYLLKSTPYDKIEKKHKTVAGADKKEKKQRKPKPELQGPNVQTTAGAVKAAQQSRKRKHGDE